MKLYQVFVIELLAPDVPDTRVPITRSGGFATREDALKGMENEQAKGHKSFVQEIEVETYEVFKGDEP